MISLLLPEGALRRIWLGVDRPLILLSLASSFVVTQVWTTVTFAEERGKTKITVQQTYSFESDATRGAPEGWRQTLDRLGEYLARA